MSRCVTLGLWGLKLSDVSIVVAVDLDGGFGKGGKIPWHYQEDFAFFKKVTASKACVMGRVTYEEIRDISIAHGRTSLLPGRPCYVVSNTMTEAFGATVIASPGEIPEREYCVIGGRLMYNTALDFADRVYLTTINKRFGCDTFFKVDMMHTMYKLVETFPSTNPDLKFELYERK